MKEFIVSGIQFAPHPMDIETNLKKMEVLITKAKKEGADLVVLPESSTTGFVPNLSSEKFYEMLSTIPGKETDKVGRIAENVGVHIVFPTYEKGENGAIYNSSVLLDDSGKILGVYRKTHPFPTERIEGGGWTTRGSEIVVAKTKFANVGLIICYDGDFPELSRCNALNGAEVIVRPSAFMRTFEIWDLTNRAMAYENHVYVVAVNAVGRDGGNNHYFGGSMIVNPIAQKLAQAGGGEDIIYAKLDPDPIKYISYGTKSPMTFDHLEDRNMDVYGDILKSGKSRFEPSKRVPHKRCMKRG